MFIVNKCGQGVFLHGRGIWFFHLHVDCYITQYIWVLHVSTNYRAQVAKAAKSLTKCNAKHKIKGITITCYQQLTNHNNSVLKVLYIVR